MPTFGTLCTWYLERHLKGKPSYRRYRPVFDRILVPAGFGPGRVGRVEFEEAGEQHRGDVGGPHRQAGMPGLRLLDRIHGERADGVGHQIVLGACIHGGDHRGGGGAAWSHERSPLFKAAER